MIKNKNARKSSSVKSSKSFGKNKTRAKAKPKYNMLTFGKANGAFVETRNGKEAFKVNISFVTDESSYTAVDENEREYSADEAMALVVAALENGKRISFFCFERDEASDYGDTHSGNARIDINGLDIDEVLEGISEDDDEEEEEEPAPVRKKTTAKTKAKRNYEQEIEQAEDDEETEVEEIDTNDIPY